MSIVHYALALYAALVEAKVLPEEELQTYAADDSRLPMSAMATYTPGVEIAGGSLGHGLSIALGIAMGLNRKGSQAYVCNLLSDGELDEGSTWEAAMVAAHHKLDNLIAIVDFNGYVDCQQTTGVSHMTTLTTERLRRLREAAFRIGHSRAIPASPLRAEFPGQGAARKHQALVRGVLTSHSSVVAG